MILSAICLEYGRPEHLNEAVACFLGQDYEGERELLIFNSFPKIKYHFDHPNVRIVNCDVRPPSLGDCRNLAIEAAKGTHIVTWDSDDLYLPSYLSTVAKHFGDNHWTWHDKQFYATKWRIKGIVKGSSNVVHFTKEAWLKAGKYKPMGTGEDRDFVGRLTTLMPGKKIELKPEEIQFIYSWDNGAWHISGKGDDKPGSLTSYRRAEVELKHRVIQRKVPTGDVNIVPKLKNEFAGMSKSFLTDSGRSGINTKDVCCIMLGRYGDLCGILPVFQLIAERFGKPKVMVSREFASLLDGVSYVDPYVVEFDNSQLGQGIALAKEHFSNVVLAQTWGRDHKCERHTRSFNEESWRIAGFGHKFNDTTMRPVFDRRNLAREEALFNKVKQGDKPMLLVQVRNSASSPFPKGAELHAEIVARYGELFQVVDLAEVRAERLYDLVGLFDRAAALCTIDTALAHLAAASNVGVCLICNPTPWLGSILRVNCAARVNYNQAMIDPEMVHQGIVTAVNHKSEPWTPPAIAQPPQRRLLHVCQRFEEANPDARKLQSWKSWDALYDKGVIPVHVWQDSLERTAKDIGDKRALPYLKDVLQVAMNQAGDDDLIMFTNDDVVLHPDIVEKLMFHVSVYGPCSSQRCDFKRVPEKVSPQKMAQLGQKHLGRDLFCFTKRWLVSKWDEIGDYILGASAWDLAMAFMIRLEYGIQCSRQNVAEIFHPAEIERGYVAHQIHDAFWVRKDNEHTAPSQVHNATVFKAWCEQRLPEVKFNKVGQI